MKRVLKIAALALAGLLLAAGLWDVGTHDRAAWAADYERMKSGMARHYANLDWARDHRRLDLAALDRRTRARIDGSWSRLQAYWALRDFVAAFNDPHLALEWRASGAPPAAAADPPAGPDCATAGYEESDHNFPAHLAALGGWAPGDRDFPTASAGDTGIIRISSFSERDYAAACARVFRPNMSERRLQLAVRAELQRGLVAAIGRLKARGVRRLLIDLSGNGGGSEWDREAARLFTSRRMRRAEPRLAAPACERGAVWAGARPCPVFAGGGEVATLNGIGAWTGPVLVLVDGGTASAAEEFAGWLRDNGVARLAGRTTMGAGCGYVDGGAPVALEAAPLVLKMPNCARFTAAGRNEIEGWPPDFALPDPETDRDGWARGLAAALGRTR
jgi:hypothetical protein